MRLHAVLALVALAPAAIAAPSYRAAASVEWGENISRSSSPLDWQDGLTVRASGGAATSRAFAGNILATADAEAALRTTPSFSQQRAAELTLRTEVRKKAGLGPLAPVFTATASTTGRLHAIDGDTGLGTQLAFTASQRFHPAWRVSATAEWRRHHADSAAFDTSHRHLGADLTWDISDRWQLSYGTGRLDGTFTANASGTIWNRALTGLLGSAIQQYYTVAPQAVTDSFGRGWVTYLVSGRVRYWWVQLAPALTDDTSLALRYENNLATNIVNVKYRQELWSASLSHRF